MLRVSKQKLMKGNEMEIEYQGIVVHVQPIDKKKVSWAYKILCSYNVETNVKCF